MVDPAAQSDKRTVTDRDKGASAEQKLGPDQVFEGVSETVRAHLERKESPEALYKLGERILGHLQTTGGIGRLDVFSTQLRINGRDLLLSVVDRREFNKVSFELDTLTPAGKEEEAVGRFGIHRYPTTYSVESSRDGHGAVVLYALAMLDPSNDKENNLEVIRPVLHGLEGDIRDQARLARRAANELDGKADRLANLIKPTTAHVVADSSLDEDCFPDQRDQ